MNATTTTTANLSRYVVAIRHTPGLPQTRQYPVLAESIEHAAQIAVAAAGLEGVEPVTDDSLTSNLTVLSGHLEPGQQARPEQIHPRRWTPSQREWFSVYRDPSGAWRAGHTRDAGPYALVDNCTGERNQRRVWGVYESFAEAEAARSGSQSYLVVRASWDWRSRKYLTGGQRLVSCWANGMLNPINS